MAKGKGKGIGGIIFGGSLWGAALNAVFPVIEPNLKIFLDKVA